jgi:hypothetical protein
MASMYEQVLAKKNMIETFFKKFKELLDLISDISDKQVNKFLEIVANEDCFPTEGATIMQSHVHIQLSKGKFLEKAKLAIRHFERFSGSFMCSLCERKNGYNFVYDEDKKDYKIVIGLNYCKAMVQDPQILQILGFFKELKYVNTFYESIGCLKKKAWRISSVLNSDKYDLMSHRIPVCLKEENFMYRFDCQFICRGFPTINGNLVFDLMSPLDQVIDFLQDMVPDEPSIKKEKKNEESYVFKRFIDLVDGSDRGVGEYRWFISNVSGWDLSSNLLVDFISDSISLFSSFGLGLIAYLLF